MESYIKEKKVQSFIKEVFKDPIVKNLLNNSNLTKKQLETFLIDILAENFLDNKVTYEEKAALRISRKKITRGSFNRSLQQARRNLIKSIYTIMLLGYLGILDEINIYPYIEVANKIKDFKMKYQDVLEKSELDSQELRVLRLLQENLENLIGKLSDVKVISRFSDVT